MYRILSSFFFVLLVVMSVSMLQQCKHEIPKLPPPDNNDTLPIPTDTSNPCHPDTVYFEREILPLLISNCAMSGCHNDTTHANDINLSTYEKVIQSKIIKAFDPTDSDLYDKIISNKPDEVMPPPPMSKLPPDQIALINKWILQGAKNLKCKSACDTTNVTWTNQIKPFIKTACVGCHGGTSPSGGIALTTYNEVKQVVDNKLILGNVRRDVGFKFMPPGGSAVSKCNVDLIRIWISKGAPEK